MPELNLTSTVPWWKTPQSEFDWLSYAQMGLAVRQQSNREKQAKLSYDQTQRQLDMQGQRYESEAAMNNLRMQQVTMENEDAVSIATWQSNPDPDAPAPSTRTLNGANIVGRLNTLRAESTARKQLDDNYKEVLSEVPTAYGELKQYKQYSPEWTEALENHLGAVRESKRMRQQEDFQTQSQARGDEWVRREDARAKYYSDRDKAREDAKEEAFKAHIPANVAKAQVTSINNELANIARQINTLSAKEKYNLTPEDVENLKNLRTRQTTKQGALDFWQSYQGGIATNAPGATVPTQPTAADSDPLGIR